MRCGNALAPPTVLAMSGPGPAMHDSCMTLVLGPAYLELTEFPLLSKACEPERILEGHVDAVLRSCVHESRCSSYFVGLRIKAQQDTSSRDELQRDDLHIK